MKTISHLQRLKAQGEKITALTAYDASFAHLLSSAGVDVLLIGDSLGMTIQGHSSTLPVTVEHIAYHTQCVARGNQGSLLMADMPFMSYRTPEHALTHATTLMQAGAALVKLEGGAWLVPTITQLVERGIPVCGHLGLTPQSVHTLGGYKVQGRTTEAANQLIKDALALQNAGSQLLVLECIPHALAAEITQQLTLPVIGIGAGPHCDGQILVTQDIIGLTPGQPRKFTKDFHSSSHSISEAIKEYIQEVKACTFPRLEHAFE